MPKSSGNGAMIFTPAEIFMQHVKRTVTFTEEQDQWLQSKLRDGDKLAEVVRRIVDHAMRKETVGTKQRKLKPIKENL